MGSADRSRYERGPMRQPEDSVPRISEVGSLAVAWQPRLSRERLASLLALDARLARQVMRAREPLIGQIGLAWWRERLSDASREDPLLTALGEAWGEGAANLVPLVDGWEELLGERPLDRSAIENFAAGRGAAMASLADAVGAAPARDAAGIAGRRWALAEFRSISFDPGEDAQSREIGLALPRPSRLPRVLRGVAVLDGLSARALARGEPLLSGRGAALAALRLGMLGG
jgi:15-cis-phytoene synthase